MMVERWAIKVNCMHVYSEANLIVLNGAYNPLNELSAALCA